MSRGHPRRRKKPRDSLQACLSLFLRPDRSAPHAATVLGASAVLEGGPPFQPYTCRDQLLSRGIGAYQMTAVARHALMKGAPEFQPDLLLFCKENTGGLFLSRCSGPLRKAHRRYIAQP
jgi:hypothetical protein